MKKIAAFLIIACSVLLLQACIMGNGTTSETGKLINKHRCSFRLPEDLALQAIDTTVFDKEGYFKIASADNTKILQIFVYDQKTDPDEQISAQQKALNTPEVFTAQTIIPVKRWGKYNGKGILMDGTYNGGVVKGKIIVFAYNTIKSGFLIIQQDIGSHDSGKADLKQVEDSFLLK
jgi:hypothetical protein